MAETDEVSKIMAVTDKTMPIVKIINPIATELSERMDAPICIIAEKQKHENAIKNTADFLQRNTLERICDRNGF